MATEGNNLSEYDKTSIPDASNMRFGIVVSEWNDDITGNLLKGCYNTLLNNNTKKENITVRFVPGSFELALGAQLLIEDTSVDAVICLGCVIQGETKHFDYVCTAMSKGIMDVSLKYNKPVIFGVLTDNNKQQSIDRSGGKHGNKGDEAAISAIKMVGFHFRSQD